MRAASGMMAITGFLLCAFFAGCNATPEVAKVATASHDFRSLISAEIGAAVSTPGDSDAPILVDPSLGGEPQATPPEPPDGVRIEDELAAAKAKADATAAELERLKADIAKERAEASERWAKMVAERDADQWARVKAEQAAEQAAAELKKNEPVNDTPVYQIQPRRLLRWRR